MTCAHAMAVVPHAGAMMHLLALPVPACTVDVVHVPRDPAPGDLPLPGAAAGRGWYRVHRPVDAPQDLAWDIALHAALARLLAALDADAPTGPGGEAAVLDRADMLDAAVRTHPRRHWLQAALTGLPQLSLDAHAGTMTALPPCPWWLGLVESGGSDRGEEARRVVWAMQVPYRKVVREAAHWTALVLALQTGDAGLLASAARDQLKDPDLGRPLPGFHPARHAALAHGALWAGLIASGRTLALLCADERACQAACAAAAAALAAHNQPTHTWCLAPTPESP
jgi:hypothetical protein